MKKSRLSWFFPSQNGAHGDADKKSNRRSLYGKAKEDGSAKKKDDASSSDSQTTPPSRMVYLAEKIRIETEKIETYLKLNGLPSPGFEVDAPSDFPDLPEDIQRSRQEVIYATQELQALVKGPREHVRWTAWNHLDTLSLQLVNSFGLAKLVPLDTTITLQELQAKTTLDPVNLARVLRHAITNHIFFEPSPGVIGHSAASRLLREDPHLQDWVGFNTEDILPSSGKVLQALKTFPEATSLTQTGYNFAFDTVDVEPMFVSFGKDPPRAKRMGGAMASLTTGEGYELSYLVDNLDLSKVDKQGGTFVDIGGSHGFASVALAKKWKNTKFIVQDLPKTVNSAPTPIDEDESVAARVEMQAHDFFTDQIVKNADVYFFRWIIHNYSNPYAVSIIKKLIPALKPGARIVINDNCLREPGSYDPWTDKLTRGMDMVMLALLNAQERSEQEFKELFAAADPRFEFMGTEYVEHYKMNIIEAVWNPDKVTGGGEPVV